ncbi:MAG: alpha-glucan family phosphorylase, partial [Saprospiraceae bacterium]|nr:alpha-glucan family phosphorylase [Saprospiraceae bacterium]
NLIRDYLYEYTYALDHTWELLMGLGRVDPKDSNELFNVSHLAIRTSQEINGVSRLHGEVSQRMFTELNPDYNYAESNIGYVTNSVHFPTWVAREWLDFYEQKLDKGILENQTDKKLWQKIHAVPDGEIMAIRRLLKKRLLDWVRQSLSEDLMRRGENPRHTFEIVNAIKDDALVFGFARRFATYKRATLLFSNEKRLAEIVNNPDRPVIFLENYSMEMAKLLVQGVDVWLNNPTRPKEASGTSGMKAVMNGVMNFSVLDGWWCEGFKPGAGWALPEKDTYPDQPALQNELDAETIYNTLENDIVPSYYERNQDGVSARWVSHIKNTIAEIAPEFVMGRMLDDYQSRFYSKLAQRSELVKEKDFALARSIARWKTRIRHSWQAIELIDLQAPDTFNRSLPLGEKFDATATLHLQDLSADDVGVEVVFYKRHSETELEFLFVQQLDLISKKGPEAIFSCSFVPRTAGVFEYGFRLFPTHPMLPNRQDFGLVRWL